MAQMASDALRNYCDPHPHLSECNDDSQCVRKEERKYICETVSYTHLTLPTILLV